MKVSSLFWLAGKQVFRSSKSTRAAIVSLLVSSVFFALSSMINLSLTSYNAEFADSTGAYDFELNGTSVPGSDENFTLLAVTSSQSGQVEGRNTLVEYCSDPSVLYPALFEGSYPRENEMLLTYPAAVLYDLHPGDLVEISLPDQTGPQALKVSGIARNSFSKCAISGRNPSADSLISGWYDLNKGTQFEQIQKSYPNALLNYQRQNYKYSDRTNRLAASRALTVISTVFLFCALLSFDLIWIQKERQNDLRLYRSGRSRRDGLIQNCGTLLFLQGILLPAGYGIAATVWWLLLLLLKKMNIPDPFSTLPSTLSFSLSVSDILSTIILTAVLVVSSLCGGFLFSLIRTGRKKAESSRRSLSVSSILRKPLTGNPALWLIFLFVLVCCTGCLNLSAIACNTPLPAADEKSADLVNGSITFSDSKQIDAFYQQAEEQLSESRISVTIQASVSEQEPVFSIPQEEISVSAAASTVAYI